jgi:hypothetical protein
MYIYVITHPKFEGWIKLGRAVDVNKRLRTYQTHCPDRDFKLEFSIKTPYYKQIEGYFDYFIKEQKREWFKCSVEFSINKIKEIVEDIENNNINFNYHKRSLSILYDYIVDDKIFHTIRELSEYVKVDIKTLSVKMSKLLPYREINGFKILKQKHIHKDTF